MTRQRKKQIIIAVSLIALSACVYLLFRYKKEDTESFYYFWLSSADDIPEPNLLSRYPENRTGYFQYNPETIFASLDQGKTDLLTPLLVESPNDVDVRYDNIEWTQSDFLQVANALSQQVWNEPLDLKDWSVYFILFEGNCDDQFGRFNNFEITYYKRIKTAWETEYIARHIGLIPWKGMAEWAGDGDFSTPFFFGWRRIPLSKFIITADDAVRIAEENGGKAAHLYNEKCRAFVDVLEDIDSTQGVVWYVDYSNIENSFSVFINPFTGKVER
jgi:hypothetical protein